MKTFKKTFILSFFIIIFLGMGLGAVKFTKWFLTEPLPVISEPCDYVTYDPMLNLSDSTAMRMQEIRCDNIKSDSL